MRHKVRLSKTADVVCGSRHFTARSFRRRSYIGHKDIGLILTLYGLVGRFKASKGSRQHARGSARAHDPTRCIKDSAQIEVALLSLVSIGSKKGT
jgi:hypothetical protein